MLPPSSRRKRLVALCGVSAVWVGVVLYRLLSLQVLDFERWQDWALKQHFSEITVASERGPVYDRDGKLLAVSVPAGSVYVRPKQIADKRKAAHDLARLLDMQPTEVSKKIGSTQPFVWLARQIPRQKAERVSSLNLPGVGFVMESRRFYPYNEAAGTVIGRVSIDGQGLSGIEALYEKRLHGEHVKTKVTRDAFGNVIQVSAEGADGFEPPKGDSITLTVDAGLQVIVDEELENGRASANAKGAVAIMADSNTGEILAISQAPTVNLNDLKLKSKDLVNQALETVFEPGSIMKPIVAASAIEAGVVTPGEYINCEHGRYPVGRHTIKDVHPVDTVTFKDVLIRSSNIGMTKVGMRMGRERLYDALRAFGIGQSTHLGLPGETPGILRPLSAWALVDVATHSFGQGVAVTPLQMVRAFAAIANGGNLPTLHLVNDGREYPQQRVISAATAEKVRDMLYGVVEDEHGTGGKAAIKGIRIGGKTGTAQVAREGGRGYKPGAYMASFIGFANGTELGVNRTLTLMVVVKEPNTNTIYGGSLAGPIFQRVMQRSLNYLAVKNQMEGTAAPAAGQPPHDVVVSPKRTEGVLPVSYRR